jgi:hypothetical protein
MTMSEFDTLRADITGLRTDLQTQIAALRGDLQAQIAAVRADMEVRLIRLEVKIDEKPSAATIYQAALATFTGMFAVVVGTIIILKTTGFIP